MVLPIFLHHLAYLEIDSMMIFPTLAISLGLKVRRDYRALLFSILVVFPAYVIWDFWATYVGSWGFNREWVLGLYLGDLPVEEVLFFFVTPFATLLIYDFLRSRVRDLEIRGVGRRSYFLLGLGLTLIGVLLKGHSYTSVVLIYLGVSFIASESLDPEMLRSRNYWTFVGLSYVPFLVFDHFLTSIPIVVYGTHSILGPRIFSIPVEDFLYSLSMLNFYTLVYRRAGKNWIARK